MRTGYVIGCFAMCLALFVVCCLLIPACYEAIDDIDRKPVLRRTTTTTIVGGKTNITTYVEYVYK